MNRILLLIIISNAGFASTVAQQIRYRGEFSVKVVGVNAAGTYLGQSNLYPYQLLVYAQDSTWSVNLGSENGGIKCFGFHPTKTLVAIGSYNGAIELWDFKQGTRLWSYVVHDKQVNDVKFSAEYNFLATCSADGKVKLFWTDDGGFIEEYVLSSPVNSIEFHPIHKNIFVTGDHQGNICYWKINNTKKATRIVKAHTGFVFDLEFTSDGEKLLSASHDKTIKTWQFSTGALLHTSEGHTKTVYSINISPDGKTFASGGFDKKIGIWNLQTGGNIKFLSGHTDYVNVVHFTPEGHLLSGSRDGTLRIWDNTK